MQEHHLQLAVMAFITALVFSPVIARFARRMGVVSGSGGIRWNHEPKPLLGGVSIVLALIAVLIVASLT